LSPTLDLFILEENRQEKNREEKKQFEPEPSRSEEKADYKKVYIVTQVAYENFCSKCRMLRKAEEIESPMFQYRIFCKASYCTGVVPITSLKDQKIKK